MRGKNQTLNMEKKNNKEFVLETIIPGMIWDYEEERKIYTLNTNKCKEMVVGNFN